MREREYETSCQLIQRIQTKVAQLHFKNLRKALHCELFWDFSGVKQELIRLHSEWYAGIKLRENQKAWAMNSIPHTQTVLIIE